MDAGVAVVDSDLEHSSARLFENEDKVSKRGVFSLVVLNAGNAPANMGSENITIALADGTPVAVIPYDRLLKEEKNTQMWQAIAAGMSAASNNFAASQAGRTYGTTTYQATTWGRSGTANTYGTATYAGYNAGASLAAQNIANQQNSANFERLAQSNAASLDALKQLMRTTTVDPGSSFGGLVTYELPKTARSSKAPIDIIVTVDFGGDEHKFAGKLQPR